MKINLFLLLFTISSFAYGICISKDLRTDIKCNCVKKKNCFTLDQNRINETGKYMVKDFGKEVAKKEALKELQTQKAINKFFQGDFSVDLKKINELKAETNKLKQINEKLKPVVEKKISELTKKKFSLDAHVEKIKKFDQKIIKKHKLNRLRRAPVKTNKQISKKSEIAMTKAQDKINKTIAKSPDKEIGKLNFQNKLVTKTEIKQVLNKNFKINKLHKKDINLFDVISNRYLASYDHLDVKDESFLLSKKKMNQSLKYLVKKHFQN